MVKVSIIMPLYNAAKYLEECLQSVLGQTFSDFELICINDASTDATLEILRSFQKEDSRINILTNSERCGAAVSRNKGMSMASGRYLAFLDGDDIFDERMLEKAYCCIEANKADIVMYEYKHVPSVNIHHKIFRLHGKEYRDRYCSVPFSVKNHMPYEFLKWSFVPWNKLYSREFIISNKLEFQSLSCANDVFFVCMALMLAQRVIVLNDDKLMVYARFHSEPTRISFNRDPMCTYLAMQKVEEELIRRGAFGQLFQHFYLSAFFALRYAVEQTKDLDEAKKFYQFLQSDGIAGLRSLGQKYYWMLDEYIKSRLESFEQKSYESKWYLEENILKLYLEINAESVTKLFHKYMQSGSGIGIWGTGVNGKTLLEFCMEHQLEVEAVIDKNNEKWGEKLFGYEISRPEAVLDKIQVIVISAQFIYDSVMKEVQKSGKKIEVIDINQYLNII